MSLPQGIKERVLDRSGLLILRMCSLDETGEILTVRRLQTGHKCCQCATESGMFDPGTQRQDDQGDLSESRDPVGIIQVDLFSIGHRLVPACRSVRLSVLVHGSAKVRLLPLFEQIDHSPDCCLKKLRAFGPEDRNG